MKRRRMSLERIRELTEKLTKFPPQIGEGVAGAQEYKMEQGTATGWFVFEEKGKIGIHKWYSPKGTEFPRHQHGEHEWIIVYDGSMILTKNTGNVLMRKGDFLYNAPDEMHGAIFKEDCWYVTITIPPCEEFPDAR